MKHALRYLFPYYGRVLFPLVGTIVFLFIGRFEPVAYLLLPAWASCFVLVAWRSRWLWRFAA